VVDSAHTIGKNNALTHHVGKDASQKTSGNLDVMRHLLIITMAFAKIIPVYTERPPFTLQTSFFHFSFAPSVGRPQRVINDGR